MLVLTSSWLFDIFLGVLVTLNKQIHAFTYEEEAYDKLASVGLSFGYNVIKLNSAEQLFSSFDQYHPHLIIIDSDIKKQEVNHILKYLLYSHCPYAILFLGKNNLIDQPEHGMREVISELNIIGHINKPMKVDDIMNSFETVELEPELLTGAAIQQAIKNDEFELYYQPIVTLSNKQIRGAEALIRWNHPTLGIIGPDKFIPLAESQNVIHELSEWTFSVCIKQIHAWQQAGLNMNLAINLSETILSHESTFATIENLCDSYQVNPSDIVLEISEFAYKKQIENCQKILAKLKNLGCKLVIDDFELKYFNLPEMLDLEVDAVKLNRIHVLDFDKNPNAQKITKSIIDIAHTFNFEICATGIENLRVWELLTDYGCDHAQGYYICKPVAVSEFNKWVGIQIT